MIRYTIIYLKHENKFKLMKYNMATVNYPQCPFYFL